MENYPYPSGQFPVQLMPLLVLAAYAATLIAQKRVREGEITDEAKKAILDLIESDFVFGVRHYLGKHPPDVAGPTPIQ